MFKKFISLIPLLVCSAVAADTKMPVDKPVSYELVEWQQPDCSSFRSFKSCQNSVKLKYRKMRQTEMRQHGLSFDYFERPSFKGKDVGQALKDNVSGLLVVSFDVNRNGTTNNVVLSQASSDEVTIYSESLIEAIKLWTFVPNSSMSSGVKWQTEIFFEPEECKKEPEDGVEKRDCYAD